MDSPSSAELPLDQHDEPDVAPAEQEGDPGTQAEPVSFAEDELKIVRQSSASSANSLGVEDEPDGATASASALFANQDEDEFPIGQQSPVLPVQPQQLAATLRGAQQASSGTACEAEVLSASAKHVFVFSTAGKPIYTYHGDESRLAGLMATAEAILAVAHSKGHTLKHVRAGQHVFVFLERPPLCLVGVSALAEPPAVLRMQLILLHSQIVSLLTATALSAMFARNPGYDARKLLGGSEGMMSALVDSFTAVPAVLLGAYPSLPLLGGVRQALVTALAATLKATDAVHGLVVANGAVAAACAAVGVAVMLQWDVLLLLNLLGANQSFRHSGEAMTPVCLPRYNPAANLHAYIHYLDGPSHTAVVLLCGGMPNFTALSAARQHMQQQLEAVGTLQAIVQSAEHDALAQQGIDSSGSCRSLLAVQNLPAAAGGGTFGSTPLLNFIYKLIGRQQYVMSPFSLPLVEGKLSQSLVVAYSQLRAAMYESSQGGVGPLQRLRFERRPRFVMLGAVAVETELYVAFDPLTDQAEAAGLCSRLGAWLATRHDQLFGL